MAKKSQPQTNKPLAENVKATSPNLAQIEPLLQLQVILHPGIKELQLT